MHGGVTKPENVTNFAEISMSGAVPATQIDLLLAGGGMRCCF